MGKFYTFFTNLAGSSPPKSLMWPRAIGTNKSNAREKCILSVFVFSEVIMVISCRFYEQRYPEVEEVVMVNVW